MINGHYTINDIVKRVDRNKTTILRWEEQGLIPEASRDSRGWRYYTQKDFDHIVSRVKETDYFRNLPDAEQKKAELDVSRHIERIKYAVAAQEDRMAPWKIHSNFAHQSSLETATDDWII